MADDDQEKRNLPAIIEQPTDHHCPIDDVIDAEFVDPEADQFGAYAQPRRRLRRLLPPLLAASAAAGLVYSVYFRTQAPQVPAREPPAGWIELGSCSSTKSLDGTKSLDLDDEQNVELRDTIRRDATGGARGRVVRGKWSYDQDTGRYALDVNGETQRYVLVSRDSFATCILLKGDLDSANLGESWFSTIDEDDGDYDWDNDSRIRF